MKLKINKPLKNYAVGQIVEVKDSDTYWINRVKDAEIDNCVEIIELEKRKDSKFKSEVKNGKSTNKQTHNNK
jgi:hypothetical protein